LLAAIHGTDLASIKAQGGPDEASATVASKRAAIQAKIKLEDEADEKRLAAKEDQGVSLMNDSLRKKSEAGGIHVAKAEDDAETLAKYKANAEAAQKGIKESSDWLNKIAALRDNPLSALTSPLQTYKMYARYGTMSGSEAMGLERENIGRNQMIVDAYTNRFDRSQSRDDLRKRRASLHGEAASEESSGEDIFYNQLPADQADAGANKKSRSLEGLYKQQNVLLEGLDQLDQQATELQRKGGVTREVGRTIMQLSSELDLLRQQLGHEAKRGRPT